LVVPLAAERTINGSYGRLFNGENWLANIQRLEARITIERREVRVAGTRHTGYKGLNVTGEGTITGLKVTDYWLKLISRYMRDSDSHVQPLNLRYELADPENGGVESVELIRCRFWEVPFGFQVNELIEEAIPFTFENLNIHSCLSDDMGGFEDVKGINECGEVTVG
jgi:tail tube protein